MSLKFKFIPLTFQKNEDEIVKQIRNTVILKHFFEKNKETIRLEKLIEKTQYGYNASALESGKNKFLRISDITDGAVNWDSVPYCDCSDENTYLLHDYDMLVARTGGTTGKSFFITNPPEHAIYAGYLIRIRANEETVPEYINVFLNSYVYWSQIVSLNEGEFRPSVNANTLKSLILPNCHKNEQLDVVKLSRGIFTEGYENLRDEINYAIESYLKCKKLNEYVDNQIELIEPLKQSILQDAIQGKLTQEWRKQNPDVEPATELLKRIQAEKAQLIKEKKIKKEKPLPPINENEIPFELPKGWTWCRLKDLIYYRKGKKPNSLSSTKKDDYLLPYIDIAAFEKGIISNYTNDSKAVLCDRENILLVWDGSRMGLIGRGFQGAVGSTLVKINILSCDYEFIFNLLNSYFKFFNDNPKQAGLPHMNGKLLDELIVGLPSLKEQKIIVEKIKHLLEKCNALQNEVETTQQQSDLLLKALFNEIFEVNNN